MKVNVAGAGAGKTTKMADLITEYDIQEGKILFCIAFTNAAAKNIENKVVSKLGKIPNNIKVSTIHSFLYQEFIHPYYFFLFGRHYEQLSAINLPENYIYRMKKLSELDDNNQLHYSQIPEKAKWVVYKKTGDTKAIKRIRTNILERFSSYCAAIFVDEAQDISEDVRAILESLEAAGVGIILYGDPKQDVKGLNQFRTIIDKTEGVVYLSDCYRCPQKHLVLSNLLARDSEKQVASMDNAQGSLVVIFESDISNMTQFICDGDYGLKYISMKRDRFATHRLDETRNHFETLQYEICMAMEKKWKTKKTESEIKRCAFYVTEQMLREYDRGSSESVIINKWIAVGAFDRLNGKRYAQMASAIAYRKDEVTNSILVSSIEIIKGLEAENCLFILTADLSPYLFDMNKEDNKISHLLYVALTRSLEKLTILVTKEVEKKHTRQSIEAFFSALV